MTHGSDEIQAALVQIQRRADSGAATMNGILPPMPSHYF